MLYTNPLGGPLKTVTRPSNSCLLYVRVEYNAINIRHWKSSQAEEVNY
jgi:hypothetical protein